MSAVSPIAAKDLNREAPRSPFGTLNGYPWLPRLIDKVRAMQAGTLGGYLPYPCPGDQRFVNALGVTAEALRDQIQTGADDAAIAAWVSANVQPGFEERLAAYRAYLLAPSAPERQPALAEAKAELAAARPDLDLSWVDSFVKLICAEEDHAFLS
jgi:hypothetical protein